MAADHKNAPALLDGELVDDRSLEGLDADRFRHGDFVRELAGLVQHTRTPANIALFGSWGSGKSGIANLLGAELTDKKQVRFVVFEASKYAEAPLRRHFISQVAHGLGIKDKSYHEGLYKGVEDREVKFRPREWAELLGAFMISVAVALVALLLIATVVAAVSAGPFEQNWSSIVRDYLLAALPVAALITAFVKLAGEGFHLKTTRSAPSGDEEFERRFSELVAAAKTERLVVFIDELDRCSPVQVASVLETLKTFLFIQGCVFVVAADQQVLEQALRRKVRQHTPEDPTNPYYSAGSSYLDKVFQFQLTLPPLRATTLTRYALGLVDTRSGVWRRVPGLDEVVAVLIPTHVTSPRRIKVLLNRFAIAYRLAERRAMSGHLDPKFACRATELAKLVCLQCEFPLFAEDLTMDARLPGLVRMIADGESPPENLPREVVQRARAYAQGRRVVAELLVGDDPEVGVEVGGLDEASPDARVEDEDEAESDGADERDGRFSRNDEGDERTSRADAVARHHAQQLVNYLRKTSLVNGPAPDLLYLESAGAGHGIDAVLADRLQRAALDNNTAEVLALVTSAGDADQGRGALLVLADVVRQAQPGLEGRNVVSALLQSVERSGLDLDEAADPIADAVTGHLAIQTELQEADLMGALALAGASNRDVGPVLLDAVLRHKESTRRTDIATALVGRAAEVSDQLHTRLAMAATTALLHNAEAAAQRLLALPLDSARQLLNATKLKQPCDAHYAALEAGETENAAVLETPPHRALGSALDVLVANNTQLGADLARIMLGLNHADLEDAAADRLAWLQPVRHQRLIEAVLDATHGRTLDEWTAWLGPLDAEAVGDDQHLQGLADSLACAWWDAVTDDSPPADEVAELSLRALERVGKHATIHDDLQKRVARTLDEPFSTEDDIQSQDAARLRARALVDAGLLNGSALADVTLSAAAQTLGTVIARHVAGRIAQVTKTLLSRVETTAPDGSDAELRRVLEAASDAAWLAPWDEAALRLIVGAELARRQPGLTSPVASDQLHELTEDHADEPSTDLAVAWWLESFAEAPEAVWHAIRPLTSDELPERTRGALGRYAQRLNDARRLALVDIALTHAAEEPVHRSFFQAAHLSEVPAHRVADRLIELFAKADEVGKKRTVMDIWAELNPTGEATRKRLVQDVYIPLIASGDEGLDLALSHFGLVATAKGVRKPVTAALQNAARTGQQKRRVDRRLLEAGWRRRSLLGLGPAVDQDK